MAKGLVPSPSIDDDVWLATPDQRAADEPHWRRPILLSGLIHALILVLLIGLWPNHQPKEFPPITVALVLGTGAAGAAGGSGGGATAKGPNAPGAATEAQAPSAPTTSPDVAATAESAPPAEETPAAEPPQPAETTAETPATPAPETPQVAAAPPPKPEGETQASAQPPAEQPEKIPPAPPRKPRPPQPASEPVTAASPSPARHPTPTQAPVAPVQTATATRPAPTPGTPGNDEGIGGPAGRGQGIAGAGEGVVGAGKGPGDDYLDRVRRHIRQYLTYPEVARKQKREGDATMAVVLRRDGTVLSAKIERSTGYPELDNAILKAVHDASPVPPFPKGYDREQGEVILPFDFHLGFIDRIFR